MKRILLGVVLTSVVGATTARAQILVPQRAQLELSGTIDTALAWGSAGGAGSTSQTALIGSGLGSSHIKFRGHEDLGGGLSASYWLEMGFNSDSGTGTASNSNNQVSGGTAPGGLTFGRTSWVDVGGSWGRVRLGRDYTTTFWGMGTYVPLGPNGVGSSLVLSGIGVQRTTAFGPFPAGNSVSFPGAYVMTRVRASNTVAYISPEVGGFTGWLQYYLGENGGTAAAGANPPGTGEDDGNGTAARIGYKSGPLDVGIAYQKTRHALLGDFTTWNIGGQYDFGAVRVFGLVNQDRSSGSALVGGAPSSTQANSWSFGVTIPVFDTDLVRLGVSRYSLDLGPGENPTSRKYAVSYVKNLSKRTALYTTYAQVDNAHGANTALNGARLGAGVSNQTSRGFEVGVRHNF